MASATLQTLVHGGVKFVTHGATKPLVDGSNFAVIAGPFASSQNASLSSGLRTQATEQGRGARSRARRQNGSFMVVNVATIDAEVATDAPASSEANSTSSGDDVSTELRKKLMEEASAAKPYKFKEVETTGVQEWNAATVLSVEDVAPGIRCITVETEASRELVALEKAYTAAGQVAQVRVTGGEAAAVLASSAPFPSEVNAPVLYKLRGDIPAGATKAPQFTLSARAPLDLHVTEAAAPSLYNLQPGADLEVGPFAADSGLNLKPIMFLARFRTILLFASGAGIAPARALLEARDVGMLYLNMRDDVRFYYWAPTPSELAYKSRFGQWEQVVRVRPTVGSAGGEAWSGSVGSFAELFDADDLEYDPETTAAVVCGERAANEEVMALLREAGVPEAQIVRWDSP